MAENKKKNLIAVSIAVAVMGILIITGFLIFGGSNETEENRDVQNRQTETAEMPLFFAEEEAALDKRINEAIDAYLLDFAKKRSFSDIMTDEDKSALGRDIIADLSEGMEEQELDRLKEILVTLFSDNSNLTITGSAYLTEEAKAYLADEIKAEIIDSMTNEPEDGTEGYYELKNTVERIVHESIDSSDIGYSVNPTDIENIRQSIIASLGSMEGATGAAGRDGSNGKDGIDGKDGLDGKDGADGKDGLDGKDGADGKDGLDGKDGADGKDGLDGKDGADGKDGLDGKNGIDGKDGAAGKDGIDGRDGRDGKDGTNGKDGINGKDGVDGKDGHSPVKGTDYFTESEIDLIVGSISSHIENYVDVNKPVKGKDYFTEEEISALTEVIQNSVADICSSATGDVIGTGNGRENSNLYTNRGTYKKGEVIVRDDAIYICTEDIKEPEDFDEQHWKTTDLISVNNYYNEYFSQTVRDVTEQYDEKINDATSTYDGKLDEVSTQYGNRLNEVSEQYDSKLGEASDRFNAEINNMAGEISTGISELDSRLSEKIDLDIKNLSDSVTAISENSEKKIEELVSSQPIFNLINNGDGTYTLEITGPVH